MDTKRRFGFKVVDKIMFLVPHLLDLAVADKNDLGCS